MKGKITVLAGFFLVGCASFASTELDAELSYAKTNGLAPLSDIGDEGGKLVVAVINKQDFLPKPKLPRVDSPLIDPAIEHTFALRDFIRRSGISGRRINPDIEFGAIYYIPRRYCSPSAFMRQRSDFA
ncbi:MAG: hypothetical protein GKR97_20490 [Rhizobiaceae bacterium]|nr:hypothetical protein [Rhizobiaceae bacterium]